jgi:hypothetical protein
MRQVFNKLIPASQPRIKFYSKPMAKSWKAAIFK